MITRNVYEKTYKITVREFPQNWVILGKYYCLIHVVNQRITLPLFNLIYSQRQELVNHVMYWRNMILDKPNLCQEIDILSAVVSLKL